MRSLCFINNEADQEAGESRVRLVSRNGNAMNVQYPELMALPHQVRARSAVLDAEVAALDERGAPSFERLQRRMHVADASSAATLSRSQPVVLYVFDLLYADGRDLRDCAIEERKRLLKEILEPSETIRLSEAFEGDGAALLEAVKAQGIEGIVGKRKGSVYQAGRVRDWVKYKVQESDSFVICGFTKGEREQFGALVLGMYDPAGAKASGDDRLVWTGNVGTGFDRRMMEMIREDLAPLVTGECPLRPDKNLPREGAVTWVRPELVCEVRYTQWTSDGRLRAPVFLGMRPDIDPEECVKRSDGEGGGPATDAEEDPMPELLEAGAKEAVLTVDGHRLKFTNLDKVFFPEHGYTKRDLLNYYDRVAELIVPHLEGRPLSLKRYPNGIHEDYFFQKRVPASFAKWLTTAEADGIRHVIGESLERSGRATLLYLVNLGCIDHNPWMSQGGVVGASGLSAD